MLVSIRPGHLGHFRLVEAHDCYRDLQVDLIQRHSTPRICFDSQIHYLDAHFGSCLRERGQWSIKDNHMQPQSGLMNILPYLQLPCRKYLHTTIAA